MNRKNREKTRVRNFGQIEAIPVTFYAVHCTDSSTPGIYYSIAIPFDWPIPIVM